MANVPSAEKRNRQRLRRRARNISQLTRVRTFVKRVETAIKDGKGTQEALAAATKLIDKAAQKGILKKETASRKISRLTKRANAGVAK